MVTVHIHRDFKIYHNHLIFLILRDHAKVRRAAFSFLTEAVGIFTLTGSAKVTGGFGVRSCCIFPFGFGGQPVGCTAALR